MRTRTSKMVKTESLVDLTTEWLACDQHGVRDHGINLQPATNMPSLLTRNRRRDTSAVYAQCSLMIFGGFPSIECIAKRLALMQRDGRTEPVNYCKDGFGFCAYKVLLWRSLVPPVFAWAMSCLPIMS